MSEHHDDKTVEKVRRALFTVFGGNIRQQRYTDAISEMQNAGILFRERGGADKGVQQLEAGQGIEIMSVFTTRELVAELEQRMRMWPDEMRAARAFVRGTVQATEDAAARNPAVERAMQRRGDERA